MYIENIFQVRSHNKGFGDIQYYSINSQHTKIMEYVDFLDVNYNPCLGESPWLLSPQTALHSSGKLTQNRINYVKSCIEPLFQP